MTRTRAFITAAVTALALGAAGCGDDDENNDRRTTTDDSPVNTDTPAQPQGTTPAPSGDDPETRTTRTDGE
jgi:hypothetical protein